MATKVLVVEDEPEVRDYLVTLLTEQSFEVSGIATGEQVYSALKVSIPDLILMDYRLPGQSGVEIVRQLKENPQYLNIPIIMVTGVDGEEEKVAALELGADDYVVKPFLPKELGARIKAVLRRTQDSPVNEDTLESEGLRMNLTSHRVTLNEAELYLTLTEFRILSELIKQKGKVLSRDLLRQNALGNLNVTDRTIDVHMASLRKKLGDISQVIQTVRGVGYRFS